MRAAADASHRDDTVATVVRLEGRLDAAAVGMARELVSEALSVGQGDVVLDCSEVECVDVTGLALIISVHARLRAQERRLVLLGCRPQVRRALAVTRLSRILPMQTRGTRS
jgi:anti-sigma B factor antagonist